MIAGIQNDGKPGSTAGVKQAKPLSRRDSFLKAFANATTLEGKECILIRMTQAGFENDAIALANKLENECIRDRAFFHMASYLLVNGKVAKGIELVKQVKDASDRTNIYANAVMDIWDSKAALVDFIKAANEADPETVPLIREAMHKAGLDSGRIVAVFLEAIGENKPAAEKTVPVKPSPPFPKRDFRDALKYGNDNVFK